MNFVDINKAMYTLFKPKRAMSQNISVVHPFSCIPSSPFPILGTHCLKPAKGLGSTEPGCQRQRFQYILRCKIGLWHVQIQKNLNALTRIHQLCSLEDNYKLRSRPKFHPNLNFWGCPLSNVSRHPHWLCHCFCVFCQLSRSCFGCNQIKPCYIILFLVIHCCNCILLKCTLFYTFSV